MQTKLWNRNFTLLIAATGLGAIGGIAGGFAMSFLVFDETGSTMASALVLAAQLIPGFLLPLVIAPWMDRMLYTGAAAVLSLVIGALGEVLDYRLCVSLCGGFSMAVCLATIWRGRKYVRAVYERSGE